MELLRKLAQALLGSLAVRRLGVVAVNKLQIITTIGEILDEGFAVSERTCVDTADAILIPHQASGAFRHARGVQQFQPTASLAIAWPAAMAAVCRALGVT